MLTCSLGDRGDGGGAGGGQGKQRTAEKVVGMSATLIEVTEGDS